jgi:hypothetical protein
MFIHCRLVPAPMSTGVPAGAAGVARLGREPRQPSLPRLWRSTERPGPCARITAWPAAGAGRHRNCHAPACVARGRTGHDVLAACGCVACLRAGHCVARHIRVRWPARRSVAGDRCVSLRSCRRGLRPAGDGWARTVPQAGAGCAAGIDLPATRGAREKLRHRYAVRCWHGAGAAGDHRNGPAPPVVALWRRCRRGVVRLARRLDYRASRSLRMAAKNSSASFW